MSIIPFINVLLMAGTTAIPLAILFGYLWSLEIITKIFD